MGCAALRRNRAIVMRGPGRVREIMSAPSPLVFRVLAHHLERNRVSELVTGDGARWLKWLMISVLAALLGWFGFRGYLNPELLFHFANSLYC